MGCNRVLLPVQPPQWWWIWPFQKLVVPVPMVPVSESADATAVPMSADATQFLCLFLSRSTAACLQSTSCPASGRVLPLPQATQEVPPAGLASEPSSSVSDLPPGRPLERPCLSALPPGRPLGSRSLRRRDGVYCHVYHCLFLVLDYYFVIVNKLFYNT